MKVSNYDEMTFIDKKKHLIASMPVGYIENSSMWNKLFWELKQRLFLKHKDSFDLASTNIFTGPPSDRYGKFVDAAQQLTGRKYACPMLKRIMHDVFLDRDEAEKWCKKGYFYGCDSKKDLDRYESTKVTK
jgi:hypothetical protein